MDSLIQDQKMHLSVLLCRLKMNSLTCLLQRLTIQFDSITFDHTINQSGSFLRIYHLYFSRLRHVQHRLAWTVLGEVGIYGHLTWQKKCHKVKRSCMNRRVRKHTSLNVSASKNIPINLRLSEAYATVKIQCLSFNVNTANFIQRKQINNIFVKLLYVQDNKKCKR